MTKKHSTKRALLSSVLALFLCFSMLLGTTFAWFTDSAASGNNVITAGNLDIVVEYTLDGTTWNDLDGATDLFQKGIWEPGHTEVVALRIKNNGSLALKYAANMNIIDETVGKNKDGADIVLSDILTVSALTIEAAGVDPIFGMDIAAMTLEKAFEGENDIAWGAPIALNSANVLEADQSLYVGKTQYVFIKVDMPETVGNEANHNGTDIPTISLGINVLATQFTYENDSFGNQYDAGAEYPVINTVDTWDGTADTSWYNDTDTEFTLTSAEQFAGFATLVSEDADNFKGKTIKLDTDIDLNGVSFAPIGTTGERDSQNRLITTPFKGTFDGNGNTIANLSQSGWDFGYEWGKYGSIGLFSELEGATVKNVVLEGFDCAIEGGDISFIAGSATGDCTFENIEIKSGSIGTFNNGIGGIIGWSGAGTYHFKDITLGEDVVIGGLWGSFDSSVGGIVGQAEVGATYIFENVNVACRLDVYNDCTASYDYYNYRMCGMLIGRLEETTTIDGTNYPDTSKYNITCTNVTVTYGEWANYHYCEPTPADMNGGRGMRVEPGYAYDGLPADYDHSQCVDNHMNLIPFDQIFGGDQIGVKGLKTYDGVDVIYNNIKN